MDTMAHCRSVAHSRSGALQFLQHLQLWGDQARARAGQAWPPGEGPTQTWQKT